MLIIGRALKRLQIVQDKEFRTLNCWAAGQIICNNYL